MIVPLPSPNCATDWNYNFHGMDWVCKCNEGMEQSPIDLPHAAEAEELDNNAEFTYNDVPASMITIVYEINMLRMKSSVEKQVPFGSITDLDGTTYDSYEIQIHTPAEHTMNGKYYDMEIQVIHESTGGIMKNLAVLSFIYENTPGETVAEINNWNLLNLPTPGVGRPYSFVDKPLNVLKLMNRN